MKKISLLEQINKWLQEPVPENEIDWTNDGIPAAFQPIWVIEGLLNQLTNFKWSRYDHKYSLHTDRNGIDFVATSHILEVEYCGITRFLLCGSFISSLEYAGNSNLIQTGIAEATKAGVKILGPRFGQNLNDRMTLKAKPNRATGKQKIKVKSLPDEKIMDTYLTALLNEDKATIDKLMSIYDIKTTVKDAKKRTHIAN